MIKKTSDSQVSMVHMPMPDETNVFGDIYGGHIMRHVDLAGSMCALRHARMRVVTAAVEHMEFITPAKPGMILTFSASVNMVSNCSMEVGIRIEGENPLNGETLHIGTCYLVFVGVDSEGAPTKLPRICPDSKAALRRMNDATRRMALTRMERKLNSKESNFFHFYFLPETFYLLRFTKTEANFFTYLAELPQDTFITITKEEKSLSLLLAEEYAKPIAKETKDCQYLAGVRVISPKCSNTTGFLSSVSCILGTAKIPVIFINASAKEYIFIPQSSVPLAVETLRSSGHFVEIPTLTDANT